MKLISGYHNNISSQQKHTIFLSIKMTKVNSYIFVLYSARPDSIEEIHMSQSVDHSSLDQLECRGAFSIIIRHISQDVHEPFY